MDLEFQASKDALWVVNDTKIHEMLGVKAFI